MPRFPAVTVVSAVLCLLPALHGLPAPPIAARSQPSSSGSGSLRGPLSLLGVGTPLNTADSALTPNYELVNGQKAPGNLGLYLDLESVAVPEPIRGTQGATDAGPREFFSR
jgi:hypothetical protein